MSHLCIDGITFSDDRSLKLPSNLNLLRALNIVRYKLLYTEILLFIHIFYSANQMAGFSALVPCGAGVAE